MKIKDKRWIDMLAYFQGGPFDPEIKSYKDSLFSKEIVEHYLFLPTQYVYVYDLIELQMTYVSPEIKNILGYEPNAFTIDELYHFVHPDDRERVFRCWVKAIEFAKNHDKKASRKGVNSIEYMMKRKDGRYIRVLRQSTIVSYDRLGNPVHALSLVTDLTHKNMDTESIRYIYNREDDGIQNIILSPREIDVIRLLLEGKTSKVISEILCLSIHTVEKHRKNMLHKNNMKNISELINNAKESLII